MDLETAAKRERNEDSVLVANRLWRIKLEAVSFQSRMEQVVVQQQETEKRLKESRETVGELEGKIADQERCFKQELEKKQREVERLKSVVEDKCYELEKAQKKETTTQMKLIASEAEKQVLTEAIEKRVGEIDIRRMLGSALNDGIVERTVMKGTLQHKDSGTVEASMWRALVERVHAVSDTLASLERTKEELLSSSKDMMTRQEQMNCLNGQLRSVASRTDLDVKKLTNRVGQLIGENRRLNLLVEQKAVRVDLMTKKISLLER